MTVNLVVEVPKSFIDEYYEQTGLDRNDAYNDVEVRAKYLEIVTKTVASLTEEEKWELIT